jgi:hypothetical protein
MSCARRIGWLLLAGVCAVSAGCGSPPDREMQQAAAAIDAAQTADADRYARDELAAAQDLLRRAGEAVEQRDYRLALNYALDSREQAQNAATIAADGKAMARAAADRALTALAAAVASLQARLKEGQTARLPARTLAAAREAAADGERRVQEARTAMDQGDYVAIVTEASAATARLTEAESKLTAASASGSRRRR